MSKLDFQYYYKRTLPHIQQNNAFYFITFRVAYCLPDYVLLNLKKNFFYLQKTQYRLLAHERVQFCKEYFSFKYLFLDKKKYDLIAYCIMPNHIHMIINVLKKDNHKYFSVSEVMHSIKSYTGNKINRILKKKGQFWYHENYDHIIRNHKDLYRCMKYIINNPVKAKLVDNWQDWDLLYISEKYMSL